MSVSGQGGGGNIVGRGVRCTMALKAVSSRAPYYSTAAITCEREKEGARVCLSGGRGMGVICVWGRVCGRGGADVCANEGVGGGRWGLGTSVITCFVFLLTQL